VARTADDREPPRDATASTPETSGRLVDLDQRHHAKGSLPMLIGLILVSVTFAAVAQLTLKYGMNQVRDASGVVQMNAASLRSIATTPAVWAGLFIFGFSAIVWLAVLSRASLSFAYPFASLTYVIILLFDRFLLHDQVPALRWGGVALIMTGIVLVAQTPHQ
jgi:drug/metabolite transporter (DMT)-like permease